MLATILMFAALLLFVLATFQIGHPKVNVLAAGLACWAGSLLVTLLA